MDIIQQGMMRLARGGETPPHKVGPLHVCGAAILSCMPHHNLFATSEISTELNMVSRAMHSGAAAQLPL
jgi:hypothetical protein